MSLDKKSFTYSRVKELSSKILEILSSHGFDYDIKPKTQKYNADTAILSFEFKFKDADGTIFVSHSHHIRANTFARTRSKLKFEGDIIGSMWKVDHLLYKVADVNTRRPKYPLSLVEIGRRIRPVKAPLSFLESGKQLITPSEEDFIKWFTMDPDSDAILESDADVCDNVQDYLQAMFGDREHLNDFFEVVDSLNEIGVAEKYAHRGYELLFEEPAATLETAYLGLKVIYSELTK